MLKIPILTALILLTASAACASAGMPARPPKSKIGVHLIMRYTDGCRKIVAADLPVIKVLDLHKDMLEPLRDYKSKHIRGVTVLRIYTPKKYDRNADPEACARDFWENVLWAQLKKLPESDRKLIDYLEGPNEHDSYPAWESVETAKWFCRFWIALAGMMKERGFRPCAASIPVGSPTADLEARLGAFVPALRAVKAAGGSWSYHAYSCQYTTDPGIEYWYSLRYRQFYKLFKEKYPDLLSLPLILTEGGIDKTGNAEKDGWQARGSVEDYSKWLTWFDGELQKDPYVIGVTLFEIGSPERWQSFDLEPIAEWLAGYLGK